MSAAYAAFSVVFGEQPSAAKWNILGTNDVAFNNGTGLPSAGAVSAIVATSESTASTTYVGLTTPLTVTAVIGATGLALVALYAAFSSATATVNCHMGFAMSGANTQAAADNFSDQVRQTDANSGGLERQGATFLLTGLSAGSTIFTTQYKANANTAIFADRRIAVVPL